MLTIPDGPYKAMLTARLPLLKAEMPGDWTNNDAAMSLQILGAIAMEEILKGIGAKRKASGPATGISSGRLLFVKQKSVGMMYGALDIHPMQITETAYRGLVRRHGDHAVQAAGSEEARKDAQAEAMEFFFSFVSSPQTLVPAKLNENLSVNLVESQLAEASRLLKLAKHLNGIYKVNPGDTKLTGVDPGTIRRTLAQSCALAEGVLDRFRLSSTSVAMVTDGRSGAVPVSFLVEAAKQLGKAKADIVLLGGSTPVFTTIVNEVKKAIDNLETAIDGLCTVQSIYFIDAFYLYRLLVAYRLETDAEADDDIRRGASGGLTKLLHTGTPWLRDFLRGCIADLTTAIKAVGGEDVAFYLKGGRALAYALGDWTKGENDWDTQLVINPRLPPSEWYSLYDRVQNEIIRRLSAYRREFLLLMSENAQSLVDAMCKPRGSGGSGGGPPSGMLLLTWEEDDDPEDARADALEIVLEPRAAARAAGLDLADDPASRGAFQVSCKAELIDVGVSRRDSVEGYEQWRIVHGNITDDRGVPIPPLGYFIDDYLVIMREVLAGKSHSVDKTPKRIGRLLQLIGKWDAGELGTETLNELRRLLPRSTESISSMGDAGSQKIAWLALHQFERAYALGQCVGVRGVSGLAQAFDGLFSTLFRPGVSPNAFDQSLVDNAVEDFGPAAQPMMYSIGWFAKISDAMEQHFVDRAARLDILNPDKDAMVMVNALCGESLFADDDILGKDGPSEIRLGASGSLAAALHARALENDGALPIEGVEPVIMASLRLFSVNDQNLNDVLIEMIVNAIVHLVETTDTPEIRGLRDRDELIKTTSALLLREKVARNFGNVGGVAFSYAPNILVIDVDAVTSEWPVLNALGRTRVTSLRDLLLEYRRRMGRIDEFGTRERLRSTNEAILAMLTDYESPLRPMRMLPRFSSDMQVVPLDQPDSSDL